MRPAVIPQNSVPAPSHVRVRSHPGECPIDLVHLARATDGDESLEAELLAMFACQAEKLGERLRLRDLSRQTRADVSHRLRGSALAIGAFAVAETAGRLEAALEAPGGEPEAEWAALEGALAAAQTAIADLMG